MIFGKRQSEYLRFQRVVLALILFVGLARLFLSVGGVGNDIVRWASITAVGVVGLFYYAIAVHTSGFGSYKQLLPLLFIQTALATAIVVFGILLAYFTRHANIFVAPEFGGTTRMRWHILQHLIAVVLAPLVLWLIASIVMWVTKRVAPRPSAATS